MYYYEKLIDGVLCSQSDPNGEFTPLTLQQLSKRLIAAEEQITMLYANIET